MPEKWTKGSWARDAYGNHCKITSENAECFCIGGAVGRSVQYNHTGLYPIDMVNMVFEVLFNHLPEDGLYEVLMDFNDHCDTTHQDILALFDRAIASCP